MAKPITSQMHAAVPAGDNHQNAFQTGTTQHFADHKPRTAFAVIGFQKIATGQQQAPGIMRRLGEFLVLLQHLKQRQNFDLGSRPPA